MFLTGQLYANGEIFNLIIFIEKLSGSRFGTPEDIEVMTRYFDKTAKPSFKGSSRPCFIRFGRSENDGQYDIRSGSIKLTG